MSIYKRGEQNKLVKRFNLLTFRISFLLRILLSTFFHTVSSSVPSRTVFEIFQKELSAIKWGLWNQLCSYLKLGGQLLTPPLAIVTNTSDSPVPNPSFQTISFLGVKIMLHNCLWDFLPSHLHLFCKFWCGCFIFTEGQTMAISNINGMLYPDIRNIKKICILELVGVWLCSSWKRLQLVGCECKSLTKHLFFGWLIII